MPPSNGPSATSFTPGPNFKLGAMKKKCGGLQKWAVRYLILDKPNKILYYYHSTKDASPRRALDLNTCTISRLSPEESPRDPGFKVTQPGVRDFIFVGSNAAIVDDWVNAIFQAKAPSQNPTQSFINNSAGRMAVSPQSPNNTGPYNPNSPVKSNTASSENFSYNGPTLAVLPNRGGPQQMASPPSQHVPGPHQQQQMMMQQQQQQQMQQQQMQQQQMQQQQNRPPRQPTQQQAPSARSTQSSVNEPNASTNNTTIVGNQGASNADTNSTLVAGGPPAPGQGKIAAGQPVPVLILTPDNKKFPPIDRAVVGIVKIGRYVNNQPHNDEMITFKSKVISRHHAEIWSVNGEVYIRDTKSQSGTFLNAMRLSEPSKESKPYRLKPGDVIQFGVDYKGATEDNARSISVRVELKTKILESVPQSGNAAHVSSDKSTGTAENQDTLVGQNNEGTTLVQGGNKGPGKNDRTLVGGGGQEDGTLYHERQGQPGPGGYDKPYHSGPTGGGQQRPGQIPNRPPQQMQGRPQARPGMGGQAPGGMVPGGMRPPMGPPGSMRPPPQMNSQQR